MKPIFILWYAIALTFPPLLFTQFMNNYNEGHPVQVFALCIALFGIAGLLSSAGLPTKKKLKWIGWSVLVGAVEAYLISFVV
jgi:hypothetical protein